jgi:hypothetical protein
MISTQWPVLFESRSLLLEAAVLPSLEPTTRPRFFLVNVIGVVRTTTVRLFGRRASWLAFIPYSVHSSSPRHDRESTWPRHLLAATDNATEDRSNGALT